MAFYEWLETTAIGAWLREVTVAFALIEVAHIIALCLFLGMLYTVNFRILGFALKSRPVDEVAKQCAPWAWAGAALTGITGMLLLSSEAVKMYENPMWPYKTWFFVAAVVTQALVSTYYTKPGRAESQPIPAKLLAFAASGLWLAIGISARYIAFV